MTAKYLIALLVVSLRAAAFYKDDERHRWILGALGAGWTGAALVCFQADLNLLLVLCVCILPQALVPMLTERSKLKILSRLLLLLLVVVPFLLPTEFLPSTRGRWHAVWNWMQTAPSGSRLIARVSIPFVLGHLTGMLLCLSDCNLILRSLLRLLGISPPAAPAPPAANAGGTPDAAQYLRGGLVGAIERLLIYIFAANAAFNAIAFVITVKGIVRYQEIVKNHSAEYVLVGTLLSTLMAMLLGMMFVRLV